MMEGKKKRVVAKQLVRFCCVVMSKTRTKETTKIDDVFVPNKGTYSKVVVLDVLGGPTNLMTTTVILSVEPA